MDWYWQFEWTYYRDYFGLYILPCCMEIFPILNLKKKRVFKVPVERAFFVSTNNVWNLFIGNRAFNVRRIGRSTSDSVPSKILEHGEPTEGCSIYKPSKVQ